MAFVDNFSEKSTEILMLTSLKWVLISWEQRGPFRRRLSSFQHKISTHELVAFLWLMGGTSVSLRGEKFCRPVQQRAPCSGCAPLEESSDFKSGPQFSTQRPWGGRKVPFGLADIFGCLSAREVASKLPRECGGKLEPSSFNSSELGG